MICDMSPEDNLIGSVIVYQNNRSKPTSIGIGLDTKRHRSVAYNHGFRTCFLKTWMISVNDMYWLLRR